MKKHVKLIFLFTLLFVGHSQQAEAQFWKKLFGKDEPKRKTPVKKPAVKKDKPAAPKTTTNTKKKFDINYPKSVTKQRYRIDVLVPLYLDELVVDGKPVNKGRFPDKAVSGMDFYEGLKLAADTLDGQGYNIDVYVHDITDSKHTPEALLAKKILDSSDLIIGAVQSQQIGGVAKLANKNKVNFISALSPSDADTKENPYFILMQPSLETHCKWIVDRLGRKYKNKKTVLYYRNSVPVDKEAYEYVTADKDISYQQVLANTLPTKQQLTPLFDSNSVNVITVAVLDVAYAESLLQQLSQWFPQYDFEVYGMPSWRSLSGLRKTGSYANVTINITAPFYFDGSTASGQSIAAMYKKAYGSSKPGEMVYRGYETMYWFAYLLNKYGTIFNEKLNDNGIAPFTRYEIKPKWDASGNLLYNENMHVHLYRYKDGSFTVE
ncbi:MAG: amino acid ABC transporter substrate-binding protein [Sphingobacteriales bacterium]|nr:MAG: amino acid ABC transporter substrate-binding protein [Sphingobacteriales bacterium]